MKNVFLNLVQKCICFDLLINALINSNSCQPFKFLSNIKNENLRNIKLICYLYEYTYNDILVIDNINSFKLSIQYENELIELIKINFSIISDLNNLKKSSKDLYKINLLQVLTYNYFNFISSIQCIYPLNSNKYYDFQKENNLNFNNNIRFFDLIENITTNNKIDFNYDSIRKLSLDAISSLFNVDFNSNEIIDEYYETFFENNKENKFYQYFLKIKDTIFKVRISDFSKKIFYIYNSTQSNIKLSSSISKDEALRLINNYLKDKFKDEFQNFYFDKDYINTFTYNNLIESYKFKYNYKNNLGKVNLNKGFYLTINAIYLNIEEIYLF